MPPSRVAPTAVPWREIETLFLDAGNTLVSIDFPWIAGELAALGVRCDVAALTRAEAAARPVLSRWLAGQRSTETPDTFGFYLRAVLAQLPAASARGAGGLEALAVELLPAMARRRGTSDGLWRFVIPGVPEALARFRALDLRLVVVSNSDGSCERLLTELGLRAPFHAVLDSAIVGSEKPDPRIFERALEAAGSPRERVAHVGDLFAADVAGARAAGVHAVLLDPYGDWPDDVGCERARDLSEVAERLAAARGR
jgi:putative hydrolase of the HAD superfamily